MQAVEHDESGITIDAEELDRVELRIPGATRGHLVGGGAPAAPPIGSTMDQFRDGGVMAFIGASKAQ